MITASPRPWFLVAADCPTTAASITNPTAGPPATVTLAWSRAATADAQTGAVRLTIEIHSDHELQLTGATSPICDHVAIHECRTDDLGEMIMGEVAALPVARTVAQLSSLAGDISC